MAKAFGSSIKRREDPRLITGEAQYLDDIQLPGLLHAAIVRSEHAHAKIKSINTAKAAAYPGVIAVFTGKDFEDVNPLPCAWQASGTDKVEPAYSTTAGPAISWPGHRSSIR